MKKKIIILFAVLITLSLTVFSAMNYNDSNSSQPETSANKEVAVNTQAKQKMENVVYTDFIYDVGTRFRPIKKTEIDKIRSINAFLNENELQSIVSIKSVSVSFFIEDKQSDISETDAANEFNDSQLELLHTADYSTNFVVRAEYQQRNKETGEIEDSYTTPHLTIVPEIQTEYLDGKDALIAYLKENSKAAVARAMVQVEKLQPAKLFFTVTKNGTIEHVRLDRSSNYPTVDEAMIEIIKKAPGTWKPAENAKGEIVDQELVISFGLMGC